MKCTECGTKCVLVGFTTQDGGRVVSRQWECPECCNTFEKPVKKPTKQPAVAS